MWLKSKMVKKLGMSVCIAYKYITYEMKVTNVTSSYNDVAGIDIILCTTQHNSRTVIYKTSNQNMIWLMEVIIAKMHTQHRGLNY